MRRIHSTYYLKRIIFLIAVLWILPANRTSAMQLSPEANIYILTCSPGSELYSVFGHSAIRVKDPVNRMDIVFNYGTFNFNTQNFYLKYAQGLLPYELSINSFMDFVDSYVEEQRSVYSQELLLDDIGKQKLFDALLENYKPENRTYLYNFLYDNCSTRIRDIINNNVSGNVEWNMANTGKNFWNLLDEYLMRMQWVKWGIHTILAQPGLQQATTYEYMFLPDYLLEGLHTAKVNGQRLVGDTETVFQANPKPVRNPWYFSPLFVFSLCTLILIGLMEYTGSRKLLTGISVIMFLASGILGCLFIFLGYFTEHPMTAPNLNLIWGNPLNLLVIPFLFCKNPPRIVKIYLKIYLFILIIGIPLWFIYQPAIPYASLALIVLMIYLCYKIKAVQPIFFRKRSK